MCLYAEHFGCAQQLSTLLGLRNFSLHGLMCARLDCMPLRASHRCCADTRDAAYKTTSLVMTGWLRWRLHWRNSLPWKSCGTSCATHVDRLYGRRCAHVRCSMGCGCGSAGCFISGASLIRACWRALAPSPFTPRRLYDTQMGAGGARALAASLASIKTLRILGFVPCPPPLVSPRGCV